MVYKTPPWGGGGGGGGKPYLARGLYAPETKMKKKYGSGDIIRKQRQAELSFLCITLRTDLFYNPTNVSELCSGNQLLTPARPPTFIILITSFPLENLVKKEIKQKKD